ncbi:ferredoxin [Flavobacterium sp. N2270]|uniref:ferredoxin n=1 Tax=Flavobacterium sp. N2270 TaxID=2986831 RepID=UPI002223FF03|nr:ferredoxin [Flavobacterium sp. N2270]
MIVVTLQRDKCIGCNYCVEMAPAQFQMSKKDGKTVLINSTNSKGFHTIKSNDYLILENCELAEKACPVKIISVKVT